MVAPFGVSLVILLLRGLVTSLPVLRNMLHLGMIKSFKHKGLQTFFESGSKKGIQANHATKLRMQLAALDTATCIEDIDIPGYQLHKLKGLRKNIWSITVNGNWRVTFDFTESNVYIVNYEDYH